MTRCGDSRSYVLLLLCLTIVYVSAQEVCDISKCRGPLKQYEAIDCKPVYANPGDCCPVQYDCSHLKRDKCYVNGREYNIGEALRPEDANPCDVNCTCTSSFNEPADFDCARIDYYYYEPEENCFARNDHDVCYQGPQVCLKEGETRATCEVNGKIYQEGEYFMSRSHPEWNCYCKPGYKGEDVEPFCKKPNRPYCSPLFTRSYKVHNYCAPIFLKHQNPQKECNLIFRCQDDNDTFIYNNKSNKPISEEDDKMCMFGNKKIHIGDEFSHSTEYYTHCMKCVCEVPPIPTCYQHREKCNVTDVVAVTVTEIPFIDIR